MSLLIENNLSPSLNFKPHDHDQLNSNHQQWSAELFALFKQNMKSLLHGASRLARSQLYGENDIARSKENQPRVDLNNGNHCLDDWLSRLIAGQSWSQTSYPSATKVAERAAQSLPDLNSGQRVSVDKPIIVYAGQPFDGKGATFVPSDKMSHGSQSEHQEPVFVVENGGILKNVRLSGADGVHFLGHGKMANCINTDVGEDAVTIDGPVNRAHDAQLAGCSPVGLPHRATVEIDHCTFNHAQDKVFQDNAPANVILNDVHVNGAHTVFRTIGGNKNVNSHVSIKNSVFKGVEEVIFRTDAPGAHVTFSNVDDDAPKEVIAVHPAEQSSGAVRLGQKPDSD